MSKHTPGPWRKCGGMTPNFIAIAANKDEYIVFQMADKNCDVENGKPIKAPAYETQRVNAQLIAAAPELLEVLEEVLELLEWDESNSPEEKVYDKAMRIIRKAKGEN